MAKKTTEKTKNLTKKSASLADIRAARKRVAGTALELASAKLAAKEAKEAYDAAIGGLLRAIDNDNDKDLPLYDSPKAKEAEKRRGGLGYARS